MQTQDRTKIVNSNYLKNLSLLLKMPKQLGEHVVIYFPEQLDVYTRCRIEQLELVQITDNFGCMKFKSFCTTEGAVNRGNRELTELEIIFASYTLKVLISKRYNELQNLNIHTPPLPTHTWKKELYGQCS